MSPAIVVFGLAVGILVGATGVGGGSLATPLLILVFGVKPVVAVGSDLVYAAITKTLGGWRHFRRGSVDMRISLWLATGSVPGALGGVYVLHILRHVYGRGFDNLVLALVAAALLVTGAATLARALLVRHATDREQVELTAAHKAAATALGLVVGFVLGISSAGSGALIAVGLIFIYKLTPRRIVGTDVFHAALLLWVAGLAHIVSGNVDFGLVGNILIGSLPGVWIGTTVSARLPQETLRPVIGVVLLASGLAILMKVGVEIPPVALFGGPVALALVGWMVRGILRRSPKRVAQVPIPNDAEAVV